MAAKVVPAQLAFLAIYCPSLASSDDTFRDQLLFYFSKPAKSQRDANGGAGADEAARNDEHTRLRQIGLAQGMVDFARSFSNGESVDHVDTEKSRIILHELEPGWWALASIDLTRLPATPTPSKPTDSSSPAASPDVEYSAREVAPPQLLVKQLLRAHNVFQIHHGPCLADLYKRLPRQKFCTILERFWARFASDWDVLMHGSPATDIYNGIKLAAGGELGMGVGEEEWGSGERDVFEDFAMRTDGLVDMMISRFGEPSKELQKPSPKAMTKQTTTKTRQAQEPWMGAGWDPEAGDGVIFSGIGALSRSSLRDLSNWTQWIYTYGEHAYGVKENPTSSRRRRTRARTTRKTERSDKHQRAISEDSGQKAPVRTASSLPPGIPRPIVTAVEQSLDQASEAADTNRQHEEAGDGHQAPGKDDDTWMKYLTLGYGSSWSGKRPKLPHQRSQSTHARPHGDSEKRDRAPLQSSTPPTPEVKDDRVTKHVKRENGGHFLIGLQGDLDESIIGEGEETSGVAAENGDWENRMLIRTLHLQVKQDSKGGGGLERRASEATTVPMKWEFQKLRVIVYVHRPFITTLLFAPRTDALSYPAFYRHLHSYLAPLHKPLTLSTAPSRVAARIAASSYPYTTTALNTDQPIFDLVYDPLRLTIHSSIPNIPEPGTFGAEGLSLARARSSSPWTRLEALNVHAQILATLDGTKRSPHEIERTAKTSRGWWLVWMRLPPSEYNAGEDDAPQRSSPSASPEASPSLEPIQDESHAGSSALPTSTLREAILIRRSRDAPSGNGHRRGISGAGSGSGSIWPWSLGSSGTGNGSNLRSGSAAAETSDAGAGSTGWGARGLVEGVGVDARKYVEGLLSLNR
ncbi:hypothetical protein IWZ00DRAFT_465818 [Phyllosticta capitalensis]